MLEKEKMKLQKWAHDQGRNIDKTELSQTLKTVVIQKFAQIKKNEQSLASAINMPLYTPSVQIALRLVKTLVKDYSLSDFYYFSVQRKGEQLKKWIHVKDQKRSTAENESIIFERIKDMQMGHKPAVGWRRVTSVHGQSIPFVMYEAAHTALDEENNEMNRGFAYIILDEQPQDNQDWVPALHNRINSFFIYMDYVHKRREKHHIFEDLFYVVEKKIEKLVRFYARMGEEITISVFRFQSFEPYLVHMGENFSREIIAEIYQLFRSRLKKKDQLISMSPRQYLLITPQCNKQVIRKRFPENFFHIKGLILSVSIQSITISLESMDFNHIYEKLFT